MQSLVMEIRQKFPQLFIMTDCSTFEEGLQAQNNCNDFKWLNTKDKRCVNLPNIDLVERLAKNLKTPVIAEGEYQRKKKLKMHMAQERMLWL